MRRLHRFSAVSLGLLTLALGTEAAASSGFVVKTGRLSAPAARVAQDAVARTALRVLAEQLPEASQASLGPSVVTELDSGERIVKMAQLHQGIPVAHRGVAVRFGADAVADLLSAKLEDSLPASVTPQITAAQAAAVASPAVGVTVDASHAVLMIWPTAEGGKLAWALTAPVLAPLPYQPVVIVDALSGEVVLKYNAVTELNNAVVYPSNPIKSPTLVQTTLPVGAGQTTLQNSLVRSLNCIDKHTTKQVDFGGFPVTLHMCELVQTAKPDATGDYLSTKPGADTEAEDAFSELSMFHHVNRAYEFFRGFQPTLRVDPDAIPTVSNLRLPDMTNLSSAGDKNAPLQPFQNAFFSPGDPIFSSIFPEVKGGAMFFGQGPSKDYSYDGDVIYHEFTHAIVNVTLKLVATPHIDAYGVSFSPGAMNEGLADFFSSALTGDGDVGEYASKDIDASWTAIRSLTKGDACPSEIGGEVHQDSVMFSGSLWDVRKGLTQAQQAVFDAAIFKAMNSSPTGDLAYEDFAKLIVDAVKASSLGATVANAVSDAFTKRGLLPKCTRLMESTGETLTGPKDLQGLWWAPGTQTTGIKAKDGAYTPGVIQFHQKLDPSTKKITVSFKSVNISAGGGLGGGSGTPFTPKLLVSFGATPIQFTLGPLAPNAGVSLVDATKSGSVYTASIDVPADAKDAFVMIGSTGESDGAYTTFQITPEVAPGASTTSSTTATATTGATGAGGATSATGATASSSGIGGNEPKDNPTEKEIGGCGCSVPGSEGSVGGAVVALAAAGIFAARRRRRA